MLWPEQIRTKPSTMLGSDGGDFKTLTHLPSYGRYECYSCFDHAVDGGLLRRCLRCEVYSLWSIYMHSRGWLSPLAASRFVVNYCNGVENACWYGGVE